ncbi:MAG: ABC transporter permease [Deltaproteobacteria bacterium]|nr:ABC transporter permease [Deltaproteobacteria bacterium]
MSLRFLLSQKHKGTLSFLTIISLLGVGIGVAALLIVLSIMSGFTKDLTQKLINSHSHIVIQKKNHEGFLPNNDIFQKIKVLPHIKGISSFVSSEMMISTTYATLGTQLKAIDPNTIDTVIPFSNKLKPLSLKDKKKITLTDLEPHNEQPSLFLGSELAKRLRIFEGEEINIVSPFSSMGPLGAIPKTKKFKVTGVVETGIFEVDSEYSYIHLQEGQKFLENSKMIHGYEIQIENPLRTENTMILLKPFFSNDFKIEDWQIMHENLFYAFRLEKIAMFFILCFVLIIASFSMIATLFMLVAHKQKQISILQALGLPKKSVQRIFQIQGLLIGVSGTLVGLLLGSIVCLVIKYLKPFELPDIYYQTSIPVDINYTYYILIGCVALFISFFSSYLPSKRASQITPIEGISYIKY